MRTKSGIAVFFAIAIVTLVLYKTGGYVAAYRETKTAHVFPTFVISTGWNNPEAALSQQLGEDAPYESFTNENSAYISIAANTPVVETPQGTPTESASSATSSAPGAVPEGGETTAPAEESAPETSADTPAAAPIEAPAVQTPVEAAPAPAEAPAVQTPVEPAPAPVETSVSSGILKFVQALVPTVYATTTEENVAGDSQTDTPAVTEDIATCFLQQKECHTITLDGFNVAGEITTTNFKSASLNFSFAANIGETALVDDKLEVRYYHAGKWREVGEIYLNKQLSNASNGQYFTATLDDVSSWEELSDVKVVIEYDRNNDSAVDLYLDAVWIDTQYRELLADVVSGDDTHSDIPENVLTELNAGGSVGELVLSDGSRVAFPYTDHLTDAVVIRTDKATYSHTGETVYASLTNTSGVSDSVRLYTAFPRGFGSVVSIEELKRNVPTTTETPQYQEVTFFCDAGWVSDVTRSAGTVASTSQSVASSSADIGGYTCAATGETHTCSALNADKTNCSDSQVQTGTQSSVTYTSEWVSLPYSDGQESHKSIRQFLPPLYKTLEQTDETIDILPGQTVYVRLKLESTEKDTLQFALVALGQSVRGALNGELLKEETVLKSEETETKTARTKGNARMFGKAEFDGDELPQFKFQFKSKRNFVSRGINALLGRGNKFAVDQVRFMRDDGTEEDLPVGVVYGENGEWTLEIKTHPRSFRPGKLTARISLREGSETFVENVDFYWGILAMNTTQTIYKPGDIVPIAMAALDDAGDTICDANLTLSVTTPKGDSTDVPVETSGLCADNNVIDVADYLATYTAGGQGTYNLALTERDSSGLIVHRIFDTFEVRDGSPFTIRRTGMTRIYPAADYTMHMEVTADRDFDGEFIEPIPADFRVVQTDASETRMYGGAKNLVWPMQLKAGQTMNISYTYDAPDISPYMYLLGPAEIHGTDGGIPFKETRQWKIASDATGNMLLYWDQTYIPTGWTCVSCLPSDSFYQRFIMGSSTAGTNGGNATQTHTATGVVAATTDTGVSSTGGGGADASQLAHGHTLTPTIGATSTLPQYRQLAVIQYNSTGEPPSIPTGAIAIFDATVPSGWTRYSAQDGNFVRSESTSTVGTTGGNATHYHAVTGTTGASGSNTNAPGTTGVSTAANTHTHTVSTSTSYVSNEPPYIEVILGKLNATTTPPIDMIAMWSGDPPLGWNTMSSSSEVMAERFLKASASYGTTGGSATHSHPDINNITSSGPSATVTRTANAANADASGSHTHSINVTSFTTTDGRPPFRTAVIAKRTGVTPYAPDLYDTPFDNEKTGTSTPRIEFSAYDPVGTDSIIYEIQWDDDADLDTSPLGDRTSDVETGCSPNCFENTVTGGDSSPFNEGERARFTIQTPLVSGTTYYWRVRAKTPTTSYGDWATTTSFTYVGGIEPSQWLQTTDAQFDTNTLSGAETFGSDSARLAISPSTEAMVAYGEGVVQTPRYRIWNGTAWSAESSANNMGGTIQWVVTKASPTRDEYVLGTQDDVSDVNVQIFNGTTDTWGSVTEMTTTVANVARRGFSLAYESQSGDIMSVYCDGDADPSYRVWNGSSWSAPATINITSVNNCEWIELASDPVSDEIILVERDTGAAYEAQVWDGSAWGNSKILGSMSDVAHEGIGLEYEESGDQALVTVSNGTASGFIWTSWNGSSWGISQTQALGDDFEWGRIRRDVGTDAMSLCYIDNDADIGTLQWDGNAWGTFTAAANERETGGNIFDGRAVDCQYETTAGRDGYIMLPYSDTTNGRFQYRNATTWSSETTLSTITDSWTVSTVRTAAGGILALFHDDTNARYDFSDWNGSSWSTAATLETSPSTTVAPFEQPIDMAAQLYSSSVGSMTGTTIDFDRVPSRQTWGEILWHTTEPSGSDVKLQVLYDSGSGCNTLVPNGTLPGNSTGFDATSSPLNISALSTSTYNRICLRANYTTVTQNASQLDDWTVTWERQAYLTQTHFRWYANAASSLTPTDPWPSGGTDLGEDSAISVTYAPSPGDVLRLRMSVLDENVALAASSQPFKLQYAAGATCSASLTWRDVGAVGSTTAAWRGYDNGSLSDAATLPTLVLSTTDTKESYEEANDSTSNPNSVAVGDEGEWDWVIQHNATGNTNYCFRVVTDGGATINEYDLYPSVLTDSPPSAPVLEAPFNNESLASTTPWFQFVAEDPESDDITYEVQIDDDSAFGSVNIDRDSQTNFDEFTNLTTPSDKDPYTPSQSVRFIPTSALSNGTTYYWRVRGKDRTKSAEWSPWSDVQSVTIDTSVVISTWKQTTLYQFSTDDHNDTEATSTDDIVISSGFTQGTTTSSLIDFDWHTTGNAWGSLDFTDTEVTSDIHYHIEYFDGSVWELIPDTDLTGNATGYDAGPISLLSVSPTIYNQIRIRADLTNSGATPHMQDWTIAWGYAVEQPTLTSLFDNEKTATTTPSFTFKSGDPQSDDLVYQISISTTQDFAASTTRQSSIHSGFSNTASSTDTSPFTENNLINFTLQAADALTNGTTYWWRVRAIDPSGGNVWSVWSDLRSFTVDTSVGVSTWFQTTNEQFLTDTLNDIETSGNAAQITSTIKEALMVYAESTVQVPRFRLWNGTAWGNELSGVSVGDTIRFTEAAAAPTRDEYIIGTEGSTGVVDVQVVDGTTDVAGNSARMNTAVSDPTQRGFDIAYETSSGDALAVSCYGTEATYRVWNGSAWTATSTITLSVSTNCEWVKLVSDPTSDEIIMVVRDTTTGAVDYEALVWNGSSWGNSMTMGSQSTLANEGIAAEYEESGGQAVVAVSNGLNNNFIYNTWNGSAWSGTNTVAIGNDFQAGRITRDVGSDNMAMCYVDADSDIGYVLWNGSAWNAFTEMTTTGNSLNDRPISCEYETLGSRDGYVMMPYSDTVQVNTRFWDGSVLSGATVLSTITDSAEVRTVRTGDGLILLLAYDDANTEYDFSYWNGTAWSTEQQIEPTSITTVAPPTIPIDMVARRYPSFTAGTIESSTINFSDGSGPKWGSISFSKTTPGSSSVKLHLYYLTSTSSWAIIPDSVLPGNSTGTTTSPVDISNVNRITYSTVRMIADLACVAGNCPTLNDWTLTWAQGINVSGTIQQYNQSSNVTSGTVAVAVNGVLQSGKTATISGGNYSIANVTVFQDDIVTVFVNGAAEANEAVGITKYDGDGDITGLNMYEHHIALGSDDLPTITNTNISQYDNSVSGDEDIFYDVAGNNLGTCVTASGSCTDIEIIIKAGATFRPDSASGGNVSTYGIENNGTFTADGNSITLSGSWDNNATFNKDGSTVIFSATTSTQSIDSTGATLGTFNNVTFGSGSGSATWTLASLLDIDGNLTVNFGTLSPGAQQITLAGNLTFGASGVFAKGSATTTFDGASTASWTDNTAAKQDMGTTSIDGTAKLVNLGAGAKVTNLTIGSDDTLSVNNNYALEVTGNWTNNNTFTAQSGTVTFSATTAGKTITPGSSSFYNIVFNGSGGNWAFTGPVTAGNDFTITNGIVTLPSATTTVTGSFTNSATFQHNNGVVLFNSAAAGKTVSASSSSFYDLTFSGAGSWSFGGANATSSRTMRITQGSVILPSGTLEVGGSFLKTGGTFGNNNGTIKFTASSAQTIQFTSSDAYNLTFAGVAGSWTFSDASITANNAVRFENGTTTLPTNIFSVGGSWTTTSGAFTAGSGTVKFIATSTGRTITPGTSTFANVIFDGVGGGWTVSGNATSTAALTITNATVFTVSPNITFAVGGTFTNSVGGSNTTWATSTLYLYSGSSYSINTKTTGNDAYGTLIVAANTDIKMWNSSAATSTVDSTGSLYSQDHAGVDGNLYIYGEYVRSSGTEYWTYANDFDGVALGGGSRTVNVRIASSSSLTFNGGLLQLLGGVGATTTIANQGSGAYALAVSGGTINAQYYSVRNTDANGLSLSSTASVTTMSDGDFQLGTNGGTMIKVTSTVIDANPLLQIQRNRFATSSGITSGFNVTETGTPSSYWWFRNHYGNFAGENFDSDPGGNPGHIRWDDSSLSITVSGHVYSDHGSTVIGNPPCDGSTNAVKIVVNGATTYQGTCNAGTGAFSISGIGLVGDVVLTGYLDTAGGKRAVTITRTPTTDIANFDLYENAVIVRHEDTSPITIDQIAMYTGAQDSDIPFTASTSTPPSTLTVQPGNELYVWAGKTFTPGGNVTLQSGGNGNVRDGRLMLATSSAFVATGSEIHTVGGGLSVASGVTFTTANSTFNFTATTSGKVLFSSVGLSFYNLAFNGSNGQWALNSTATTSVTNTFTMTAGTLTGTGDLNVSSGSMTGAGTIAMTGGTVQLSNTGSFGSASPWTFNNLIFGSGTTNTTSKTGVGSTTVNGILSITSGQTLNASSTNWVLTGGGSPFVVNGTFNAQIAPFFFTSNASTTIADAAYAALYFSPASAGTPVYTLKGGSLSATNLLVGGVNPVSVDVNSFDPVVTLSGNLTISSSSIFTGSNTNVLNVAGSWTNNGTYTHSNGDVVFNSTDTGETINAGSSSFYNMQFNASGGGWTISQNATSTNNATITNAAAFTLSPNRTLAVGGAFTNSVGGSATTWATSTLYLYSGTSYSVGAKSVATESYGTLIVATSTDIKMWNSSAATTTVVSSGSLYSQDHAGVDGDLYIWGEYIRSSGNEIWSYATDFDGVSISTSTRQVNVRIATSSTLTFSGGSLEVLGAASASTTIANQGAGRYSFAVTGGSSTMQYYQLRDTDQNGLSFSGSTIVNTLSDGDYLLNVNGGTMITVAGTVIDANPLKIFARNNFSTAVGSGFNVTATGSSVSSWKFNLHYGDYDGEAFDSDPAGDPGYLRWDDSSSAITVSGNVYSDEGSTVSGACDGSTQVVRLKIQGAGNYTASCNSSTGLYSIPGVTFNPGDTMTVFLDNATGTRRAANVSIDPISSIANMHLYENRVVVRHEDVNPITIVQMVQYDSDQDADIPFNATDAATDTLVLVPNTKLIVFTNKTFAPGGNITLTSGGSGTAWDGTLELFSGATLSGANGQSHSIGGSLIVDSSAVLNSASSTFTMTATTTGKTITLNGSSLYNIVFNGTGGNWAFSGSTMTANNDFTITAGTVTMPSATTTVVGSFLNTGGTFAHNNGVILMAATSSGKSVRVNGSALYTIEFNGTGGTWSFVDTSATSSNNFMVTNGTVTLPTSMLTVGGSLENFGTMTTGVGTVKFTANATGKLIRTGGSNLYNVVVDGVGGGWTFSDTNATTTRDFTVLHGTTTMPTGVFAVGGSWATVTGGFTSGSGTVTFTATTTGKTIDPGISTFGNLLFNSSAGGWTISQNATSTVNTTIASASSFTLTNSKTLAVGGTFLNGVGGSNTTWATSTLYLYSGTNFSMNTRTAGNDVYGTLIVATSTDVRMWNSTAATTTVSTSGSLYSQNNAGLSGTAVNGDLYIWGEYVLASGNDYWSYATDFDGTALGGSSRQVNVKIATSSSITVSGGTLAILGSTATTTIANQGTGRYAFSVTGGTLNASHYQIRNTDPNGLSFSGSPTITSLDYGDLQLSVNGGRMITVTDTAIDANASKQINYVTFATSSGISTGYNVYLVSTSTAAWTFLNHGGNYAGESYDFDGVDTCGKIRWSDSSCLFVNQGHYRWRADDGGAGAPDSEWYNASWSKRQRVTISNSTASALTNQAVKIVVQYDSDMQSDFEDLRFTDSSGTTTIPYWIESTVASASTTVWVKIASLPANGSAVVYMYYGNSGVTDGGDGANTFKTFDDFEDDNLTEYSNASLFDTNTTFKHNYLYGLDAGSNSALRTTSGGMYRTGSLTAPGDTIRFYQYMDSTQEDEPCTLFGVQNQTQNYAVCLDQYPTEKVALREDVLSNDGSATGSLIASTSVTYSVTGWYEVQVDWLTNNDMNVTVYDPNGALFTTVSGNDSTHSNGGGIGFSFWFQHGGWDFYSVRSYVSAAPTYLFGGEQVSGGATWSAAEDTALNGLNTGQNVRVRFTVQNTGAPLTSEQFKLQYVAKGAALNCESATGFADVPTTSGAGCGGAAACMTTSAQFTDQSSIADLLSRPASQAFTLGKITEDPNFQTNAINVGTNETTEIEYNFQLTTNAIANAYCFRTARASTGALDSYDHVAEAVIAHGPSISNWALNQGLDFALTEGTSTTVSATGTVQDLNGYADIVLASSTIYRSGVGSTCAADDNNCYKVPTCSLTNCAGTSCTLTCSADIRYFAEPTDVISSYSAENWLASVRVQDASGLSDTSSAGSDLLTTRALSVDTSINYDSITLTNGLAPGENTGNRVATTTVTNTGNSPIDIRLSGTAMGSIPVGSQAYSTSTFTYASCSVCSFLTGAATNVGVSIPKQTASTSPQTSKVYWGIEIPIPTATGIQAGTNFFEAATSTP